MPRDDEVKKLTAMVKEKMEGALKLNVPLVVDAGAGDDAAGLPDRPDFRRAGYRSGDRE